jgi:hypothetical protein
MSGGSGGPIIIKTGTRNLASTGAVLDQLGARRRAKAEAILAKQDEDWSCNDVKFLLRCAADAMEDYDE